MKNNEQFHIKEYKAFCKLIYPLPEISQYFFGRGRGFNPNSQGHYQQTARDLVIYIENILTGMGIAFDKDAYWEPTNCAIHFMASSQILVGMYYTVYSLYNLQPHYHFNTLDHRLQRFSPEMLKEYDKFMSVFTKKESDLNRNPLFTCQAAIDTSNFVTLIDQLPKELQGFLLTKHYKQFAQPKNQREILSSIEQSIIEITEQYIKKYIHTHNYHYRKLLAQSRLLVTMYYAANTIYGEQQGHYFHKLDTYLYKDINSFVNIKNNLT